jgi:hypothetical protein
MNDSHVIIGNEIFLYQQKAPFIPSGQSVRGALEYDPAEDKIKCHECGEWRSHLATHAFLAHGIRAAEYKRKHGFNQKAGLVNESIRRKMSDQASRRTENWLRHPSHMKNSTELRQHARSRMLSENPAGPITTEARNVRGTCHAQILEKLRHIISKLGHTPSWKELYCEGLSPASVALAFNVTRINDVMSLLNLPTNGTLPGRKYSREMLIEILRDFYVAHRVLPRGTDFRRGLVPDDTIYRRHFGTMRNAFAEAGLGEVYTEQVINDRRRAGRICHEARRNKYAAHSGPVRQPNAPENRIPAELRSE